MSQILTPQEDKVVTIDVMYELYKEKHKEKLDVIEKNITYLVSIKETLLQFLLVKRYMINELEIDARKKGQSRSKKSDNYISKLEVDRQYNKIYAYIRSGNCVLTEVNTEYEKYYSKKLEEYNSVCRQYKELVFQKNKLISDRLKSNEFSFIVETFIQEMFKSVLYDNYTFRWYPIGAFYLKGLKLKLNGIDTKRSFNRRYNILKEGLIPHNRQDYEESLFTESHYEGVSYQVEKDGEVLILNRTRYSKVIPISRDFNFTPLGRNTGIAKKFVEMTSVKDKNPEYFYKLHNLHLNKHINSNKK